ncbi:hypothetical protein CD30_13820 [Ureibacillus massiliensis 4400831 = CIP 108448 = CCUG 49529]|uniref:NAD(P)-binding domain-containing protein n=1 Tax=Ureibacillus massiliensis 4400831 = CIP 108448 = CCUG 49529 TaxID=1211035 RepID=A0A0A3J4E0_9BACL|nr:GDP-mannose 4,6-dehydratase [Ureibacillus massiliensis]KGR90048.1 hypothetical protein CD30_13820 [Ureibacillus massiliensis 4400831 = CIP 108448 = CCUG 49529]
MRALITGVQGFVGKYLADHLLSLGIEVWGTSRQESPILRLKNGEVNVIINDLNQTEDIYQLLHNFKPNYIFHLAGQSNVKHSWEDKEGTFYANVNKTIFLLDACEKYQQENPNMRLLTVGSSEEYGKVEEHELPIKETTPLRPMSPYGASKAVVSMLIQQYHKAYGLNVIHARPFNHIGPGQSEGFVTTDFAKQVVSIEKGDKKPILLVGNLSAKRDFTDVRDIVKAYYQLIIEGRMGEIYNVCSRNKRPIQEILDLIIINSKVNIEVQLDKNRLRPSDIPIYEGNNNKIKKHIQWEPSYPIEETIIDILNYERTI